MALRRFGGRQRVSEERRSRPRTCPTDLAGKRDIPSANRSRNPTASGLVPLRRTCYEAAMEAWATEFVELWQARNTKIATDTVAALERNPNVTLKYAVSDLEQMFLGALAMIIEELSGSPSREARDAYMESLWPTLMAEGEALGGIISQVTFCAVLVYNELIPSISEMHRAKAGEFLMWWYAGFNAYIVTLATREFYVRKS